ncbi:1-acyl-sn-glycerol-3-phosphate acyltransferase [Chitinibacter bivalviorum]|uniref:1-acyl-sn-glycerol-3-phosphate acyltransferase n=1 Tax=Chitinibacter bivalviorum TaxID=2739434 RepID=A0A7H9BF15_9NEIS|nr:lysophospholipid acyltransferase family protein [Chitinibacter bivalviorum]QLG86778.1 1-acyl-sn-glycerol-3-phosphate acyltransferase [Chitinibacter bivalviorum]
MIPLCRLFVRCIAWLDLALFTLAMVALSLLPAQWLKVIYPSLFQSWCRCFIRALGVQLRLHQHYQGQLPEHYILIANHPSALEDVGIPALFRVRSLAKVEVKTWFLVGKIAQAAGTLFVERESKDSRQAAQQALIDAVNSGDNIALYPEGGCKGRRIAPRFLFGAFATSLATGVPILPVFLHHEAQAQFEWQAGEHLLTKIWLMITTPNPVVHYHVFDPIQAQQFSDKEQYNQAVYAQYLAWQQRFLD